MNPVLLDLAKKATDALIWAFKNPRVFVESVMVAALLVGGWLYNRQKAQLAQVQLEHGVIADGLKQQISIRDGQIEVLKKLKGKVIVEHIYVPVESPVVIQVPDNPNSPVVIITKDRGWTFRPGLGIEWANNGLSPRLDIKLAYYQRYSLLVGGGKGGVDLSASRHLDDILYGSPRNIEAFAGYRFIRMPGGGPVVVGLRMNF